MPSRETQPPDDFSVYHAIQPPFTQYFIDNPDERCLVALEILKNQNREIIRFLTPLIKNMNMFPNVTAGALHQLVANRTVLKLSDETSAKLAILFGITPLPNHQPPATEEHFNSQFSQAVQAYPECPIVTMTTATLYPLMVCNKDETLLPMILQFQKARRELEKLDPETKKIIRFHLGHMSKQFPQHATVSNYRETDVKGQNTATYADKWFSANSL